MSLTTFPHVEQRSPEWFEQRRGMVTASVVGQLLTSGPPSAIEVGCSCGGPGCPGGSDA